ncbi:MAG: CPBP family intramembrane metalloprotease [Clostridia bacterium]|nr:CPBP family intramembrane metalloprotease [Clostridia bacterium]
MRSENKKAYLSYVLAALTALAAWYLLPMLFAGKELTLTAFYCVNALQQIFLFILPSVLILNARKPRWEHYLSQLKRMNAEITGAVLLGAVSCTVVASLVISFWLPLVEAVMGYVPESVPLPDPEGAAEWITAVLCIGVIPGIAEELFFRGVLQRALVKRFSGAGIWIAALIFALLHLDITSFPGLVFMGFLLGKIYQRRGLIASAAFHALYNLIVLWINTAGADIGFLDMFLCLIAFRFAIKRLMKEDEDHAADGAGV